MPQSLASRLSLAAELSQRAALAAPAPRCIAVVPARDEEDRIEACMAALGQQRLTSPVSRHGGFGVVVLANNCRDATASRARAVLDAAGVPHRVLSVDLPESLANPGFARGLALDVARLWLETHNSAGALLTTDSDTRVPADWVSRSLAALPADCGAVAGRFELDPAEEAALPLHVRQRRRTDHAYEAALLALAARIDPLPHDPWPNHWTASGASFALTLAAYRQIGGQPHVDTSEDRALAAALARHDIPIRHDPDIVVTTSARLLGRASQGCASTLRDQCEAPDLPGDETLEPLPVALRRMRLRAGLRRAMAGGPPDRAWENRLALPPGTLDGVGRRFGEAWARAEALSPWLVRRPLRPSQMAGHLNAARRLLRAFDRGSDAAEKIEPIILGTLLRHHVEEAACRGDEALGCLVA